MADKDKKPTEVEKEEVSYSGEPEEKASEQPKESPKEDKAEKIETDKEEIKEKAEVVETIEIDEPVKRRNWTKILLVASLITNIILVLMLFGSQASKIGMFGVTPTPTPSIEIENTPIPTPDEADLEAYEIEVQNGSGIAGEGATVKALLEKAGFKVGAVGNADTSDYEETIITVSDKVEESYIDELTKILEERGEVGDIEKFAEGEDGDVRVIIGSNLKEEDEDLKLDP